MHVDSVDEFVPWLLQNGAEILHGPKTISFGRNMIVHHPDGHDDEYLEAASQT